MILTGVSNHWEIQSDLMTMVLIGDYKPLVSANSFKMICNCQGFKTASNICVLEGWQKSLTNCLPRILSQQKEKP